MDRDVPLVPIPGCSRLQPAPVTARGGERRGRRAPGSCELARARLQGLRNRTDRERAHSPDAAECPLGNRSQRRRVAGKQRGDAPPEVPSWVCLVFLTTVPEGEPPPCPCQTKSPDTAAERPQTSGSTQPTARHSPERRDPPGRWWVGEDTWGRLSF